MNAKLIETLNVIGKPTEVFDSPDGSRVLLLPYGGRILGLFVPGSDENFYWTHPALESQATAAEFYASDQWHNSGGDRTWLAPEVDVFFPNFPVTDPYWQPRQLDPGDYGIERGDGVDADGVDAALAFVLGRRVFQLREGLLHVTIAANCANRIRFRLLSFLIEPVEDTIWLHGLQLLENRSR